MLLVYLADLIRYGLFVFLFLAGSIVTDGQPIMHYIERLTVDNGLSSNAVTDLCQDKRGFLWIATRHGLNRYDGTEIVSYFADKSVGTLADNHLYRILPADTCHLILATKHGISILDTRIDSFRSIVFPSESRWEPNDNEFLFMEKDIQGNFWLGTPSCIYRLDKNCQLQKLFRSAYRLSDIEAARLSYVYKIIPLATGAVLFWLSSGVHIWRSDTDSLIKVDSSSAKRWAFVQGSSFFQNFSVLGRYFLFINYGAGQLSVIDEQSGEKAVVPLPLRNGKVPFIREVSDIGDGWIALSCGVSGSVMARISHRGRRLFLVCCDSIYLPDRPLRRWTVDREGNRWAITQSEGLVKIAPAKQRFMQQILPNDKTGKPSGFETISFLKLGHQLFIASYGAGFYQWDLPSGTLSHYSVRYGAYSENKVWNIRAYRGDTLWLGTQQGLLWFDRSSGKRGRLGQPHPAVLDSFAITTQFVDDQGRVWMGIGHGKGVCVYDTLARSFQWFPHQKGGYPYRYPMFIAEDGQGNVWFTSDATAQLVKWIRKDNRFEKKELPLFKGTNEVQTGGLFIDKAKGILWYGVQTAGLVRYNIRTGVANAYGMDQGLSTDQIYSIEQDGNGKLWLSTAQGISYFDPVRARFINYRNTDGLPASYFSARMYYDTAADKLYAGAPGKVVYFSPAAFYDAKEPMQVMLTGLVVNGKAVPLPLNRHLRLPFGSNDISLSFTGINFANGNENRYAYKMSTDDPHWINIGSHRQVRLASLNPGRYAFTVKAARKDGSWSPHTDHLELTIRPPFVRTVWFYLLCAVIAGGGLYGWYRYRLMQLVRLEAMRSRISRDLHDDIGSRLTNISMMSHIAMQKKESGTAKNKWLKRIGQESEHISHSMREIIWNIHPANDSLKEALPRMLRFASEMLEPKKIEVKASIPGLEGIKLNMEQRRDLFLIFKEAIHNIARHSEARKAIVSVSRVNKVWTLQITDDGKGFAAEQLAYQNGLHYMEQRAIKNRWWFKVISSPGQGTMIVLEIKLQ